MARILIVDDDAQIRYMMRIILERAGHDVIEAVNGSTGLAAARRDEPDIVVTDLLMPVMDGAALIAALKRRTAAARPRIIVVSAHRDGETGADAWVDKPFHPNRLVDTVHGLLQHRVDTPSLG